MRKSDPYPRRMRPVSFAIYSCALAATLISSSRAFSLTLEEAIQRGMSRSPQVSQAQADLQIQIEKKRGAWSNVGPKASVTYNETRFPDQQIAKFGEQEIVLRDDVTKMGSLTVTQPITGLYGLVEYGHFNSLQTDFSEEGLRKAKRDAGYAAAESYLQAYQAQEQQVISEASIAAAKSAYQDAQVLQRVGRLNQGDLLKFQLALSQAAARAAQARATRQITMAALQAAIQAGPGEELTLQKELPRLAEEPKIDEAKPNGTRVEVRQAQLAAEIADYSKKLAYAKMVPSVNVFAKWDRNFGEVTGLGGEKDSNYVGVAVQWDIWNNGSSIFEVREAVAQRARADAYLAGVNDAMRLDAVQANENYKAARESMVLAQSGVAQAEEAYRIDQSRFKNGQISATDLIQSETAKSNAQGQLVTAQTQLILWHLRAQKALGQEEPRL